MAAKRIDELFGQALDKFRNERAKSFPVSAIVRGGLPAASAHRQSPSAFVQPPQRISHQ